MTCQSKFINSIVSRYVRWSVKTTAPIWFIYSSNSSCSSTLPSTRDNNHLILDHSVELDIISAYSLTMYFHSLTQIIPLLAALAPTTSAHGSHAPPVLNAEGIDDRNYMQKHVSIPSSYLNQED
jgi:hypothetical protein